MTAGEKISLALGKTVFQDPSASPIHHDPLPSNHQMTFLLKQGFSHWETLGLVKIK